MPPAGYLSPSAVEAGVLHLAATYPSIVQSLVMPEASVQGRVIRAVRIGAGTGNRNGVFLVGGTHARELINPDLLLRFALGLCDAYTNGAGLTYGGRTWSATDVRLVVENLDIFVLPLLNPDGRAFVFAPGGDQWWRKNRSVNPGSPCLGTDLNRNFDFLWPWTIGQTSASPCALTFKGASAFSEPETRNVRYMLDTYTNIVTFVDVHSYSELLLYPWGDDDNQTTTPDQNFQNPAWDGLRGTLGSGYAEYIPAEDLNRFIDMANRVRDAIAAVRGRVYTVQSGAALYPTSGVSADYAYSRHFLPGGARKVWGFVFETNFAPIRNGQADWQYGFQPPYPDAVAVMDEVSSGLMQLLLSSICLVQEVGRTVLSAEQLSDLRRFRDEELSRTGRGKQWLGLFEAHGSEVLSLVMDDDRLRGAAEKALVAATTVVESRDGDRPGAVDDGAVEALGAVLDVLEERGSQALRRAAARARRDLEGARGKTARQLVGRPRRGVGQVEAQRD